MKFFKRLFQKKKPREIPSIQPQSELVEMMYNKHLNAFDDKVIRVSILLIKQSDMLF